MIGLRLVAAMPDRFRGVVLSNGMLPLGRGLTPMHAAWRKFTKTSPRFRPEQVISRLIQRKLTPKEIRAYAAPFRDETYSNHD